MAARKRRISHDEKTREKIKISQLINRLQDHALKGTEMEQSRIKAIEILLRKSLPDLSSIQLTGDQNNPVAVTEVQFNVVDVPDKS